MGVPLIEQAKIQAHGSDVRLTRTKTIMPRADHCDFRYKLVHGKE
jgi:hypothetical protein